MPNRPLSAWLRRMMDARGIKSGRQLAEYAHISRNIPGRMLKTAYVPRLDTLDKLARWSGESLDALKGMAAQQRALAIPNLSEMSLEGLQALIGPGTLAKIGGADVDALPLEERRAIYEALAKLALARDLSGCQRPGRGDPREAPARSSPDDGQPFADPEGIGA